MTVRSSLSLGGALFAIVLGLSACGSGGLDSSTPIGSAAEHAALTKAFRAAHGIPAKERARIIDCLITGLKAHGITTHGEFEKTSNLPITRHLSASCTSKVLGAP
jgi:hypothetical protein